MIGEKIKEVKTVLPDTVMLVAVSKTKPETDIMEAYTVGQRVFGENKVQDLCRKYENLPKDISWHFIGHLQTNKVKYIAPFVSLIHAVDSLKLLKVINKEAAKNNRVVDCLLQFFIASEETKFGLGIDEAETILQSDDFSQLLNIRVVGVMGMASFVDDETQVASEFKKLKNIFHDLKSRYFSDKEYFKEISMGMSQDYEIAIKEGSTMVRLGTTIFGERNY